MKKKIQTVLWQVAELFFYGSLVYTWKKGSNLYFDRFFTLYEVWLYLLGCLGILSVLGMWFVKHELEKNKKKFLEDVKNQQISKNLLKEMGKLKRKWFYVFWFWVIKVPMILFVWIVLWDKSLGIILCWNSYAAKSMMKNVKDIVKQVREYLEEVPNHTLKEEFVEVVNKQKLSRLEIVEEEK